MHILGWQRRAAAEKLSIGNETPAKKGYVAKTRHTSKAELGEEQPSVIKRMVRPERFEPPDLLLRSYSWPNWPGLGQDVSGGKHQIGGRFSPLPTTPAKQVVATVVPGFPARIWQTKLQPDDPFASPVHPFPSPKVLIIFRAEVLASRRGGGRILMDGTHAPEKFEV